MLRSLIVASVIAVGCVVTALPVQAQSRGFNGRGGFERGERFEHRGEFFDHRRFFGRPFFNFGFFGGFPYYSYYPPYYPAYYPYHPYYPYYPYPPPAPPVGYP
jgi:hypothetical protein